MRQVDLLFLLPEKLMDYGITIKNDEERSFIQEISRRLKSYNFANKVGLIVGEISTIQKFMKIDIIERSSLDSLYESIQVTQKLITDVINPIQKSSIEYFTKNYKLAYEPNAQ